MQFGLGFVLGGVSTGVTVANWSSILKALQAWTAQTRSAVQQKVIAKIAALKAKL